MAIPLPEHLQLPPRLSAILTLEAALRPGWWMRVGRDSLRMLSLLRPHESLARPRSLRTRCLLRGAYLPAIL